MQLLQTLWTNAVGKIGTRVFMDVSLNLIPVSRIIADAFAPGADGQQLLQRFDLFERIRQACRNPPQLQQRHDLPRQGLQRL